MTTPAANPHPVRLLHQMARSGGTIIAKCLAVMNGVVLLSEIHPRGPLLAGLLHKSLAPTFSPIRQARKWYGLLSDRDEQWLQSQWLGHLYHENEKIRPDRADIGRFHELVSALADDCAARDSVLVLRDWNHIDFTGLPFERKPRYKMELADALSEHMPLRRFCTVRHPLDQWESLDRYVMTAGLVGVDQFSKGYLAFATHAAAIGFVRYEDFASDPEAALRTLCHGLDLIFDPDWVGAYADYANMTGDDSAISGPAPIAPVARKPIDPTMLAQFGDNSDYRTALALLNYDHPG